MWGCQLPALTCFLHGMQTDKYPTLTCKALT